MIPWVPNIKIIFGNRAERAPTVERAPSPQRPVFPLARFPSSVPVPRQFFFPSGNLVPKFPPAPVSSYIDRGFVGRDYGSPASATDGEVTPPAAPGLRSTRMPPPPALRRRHCSGGGVLYSSASTPLVEPTRIPQAWRSWLLRLGKYIEFCNCFSSRQ